MTFKKVQEAKQIGTQMVKGEEVPLLQPEVFVEVKNKKTGADYESKEHADNDVSDPNTATTADDIEQNVRIDVTKLPDTTGEVEYD
jgi:hypothetical protein